MWQGQGCISHSNTTGCYQGVAVLSPPTRGAEDAGGQESDVLSLPSCRSVSDHDVGAIV